MTFYLTHPAASHSQKSCLTFAHISNSFFFFLFLLHKLQCTFIPTYISLDLSLFFLLLCHSFHFQFSRNYASQLKIGNVQAKKIILWTFLKKKNRTITQIRTERLNNITESLNYLPVRQATGFGLHGRHARHVFVMKAIGI